MKYLVASMKSVLSDIAKRGCASRPGAVINLAFLTRPRLDDHPCIRRTRAAQSPHEAPHALIAAREPVPSQMTGLKRYCSTVSAARDRSEAWASAPHRGHEYTMSHLRALISVPTWPPFCQRARPVAPRTCPNLFRMVHFRGRNQDPMQESASINYCSTSRVPSYAEVDQSELNKPLRAP